MRAPSKALWAIIYAAGFAAALITACQPADAQTIDHDPAKAIQREQFLRTYIKTAHCMRDAATALLRQGSRDRTPILAFMQLTCGGPLKAHLTTFDGFTPQEATSLIADLSERSLDLQIVPTN